MRLLSSFLSLSLVLIAQAPKPQAPPSPDDGNVIRVDTRLVVLPVSVSDRNGKLVTDLPRQAFHVFENGAEQTIKVFHREDVPISLGIIIDNSGSMRDKRHKVEVASLDLVKNSNPRDEVFIVNFNDEAYLDVTFTNDMKQLEEGVSRIDSRGGTAMRDAISMSMDYLKEKGKKDKKVILVVTDGNDTASSGTLEKLVMKARQSQDVMIYAIGLLNEEDKREAKKAKRALDAITHESGGLSFYPKDTSEVERICLQVAQEIRNQYTIAYTPSDTALDGSFRQVRVTVKGPGTPLVRTRAGYYATPESASGKKTASVR
jgi:VWFA-related protein